MCKRLALAGRIGGDGAARDPGDARDLKRTAWGIPGCAQSIQGGTACGRVGARCAVGRGIQCVLVNLHSGGGLQKSLFPVVHHLCCTVDRICFYLYLSNVNTVTSICKSNCNA